MKVVSLHKVFDRVAKHLLKQNAKAVLPDDYTCAYRGQNGLKCAVGCLIKKAHYDPRMEGATPTDKPRSRAEKRLRTSLKLSLGLKKLDSKLLALLNDLQIVHDGYDTPRWPGELAVVAARHGLNTKVLG